MDKKFDNLINYLAKLPAIDLPRVRESIAYGESTDGLWWIKFKINPKHELAWRHIQEFGYLLNYISTNKLLPTVFKPISPPPYLNGGVEYLSWVIESKSQEFTPDKLKKWLETRLPIRIDDLAQWNLDDDINLDKDEQGE